MRRERDEDCLLSRWSVFAAALLIAALFGLLSGVVKDAQFPRGVQSADKGSETPHLTKREPIRALASADRKDANGAHVASGDGAILSRSVEIAFPIYTEARAPKLSSYAAIPAFWPGELARAPPVGA